MRTSSERENNCASKAFFFLAPPPHPLPLPSPLHAQGLTKQDHHTISGGWGPFATKFVVTGHEVIGKVVEVGKAVKEFKVGQRVGVGAQVGSCGECKACKNNLGTSQTFRGSTVQLVVRTLIPVLLHFNFTSLTLTENYCLEPVHGYNTHWSDKKEHQGGYSTHIRAQELFVFPVPEKLASTDAASM